MDSSVIRDFSCSTKTSNRASSTSRRDNRKSTKLTKAEISAGTSCGLVDVCMNSWKSGLQSTSTPPTYGSNNFSTIYDTRLAIIIRRNVNTTQWYVLVKRKQFFFQLLLYKRTSTAEVWNVLQHQYRTRIKKLSYYQLSCWAVSHYAGIVGFATVCETVLYISSSTGLST